MTLHPVGHLLISYLLMSDKADDSEWVVISFNIWITWLSFTYMKWDRKTSRCNLIKESIQKFMFNAFQTKLAAWLNLALKKLPW